MEEYANDNGKEMVLNKYADCTEEEYRRLTDTSAPAVVQEIEEEVLVVSEPASEAVVVVEEEKAVVVEEVKAAEVPAAKGEEKKVEEVKAAEVKPPAPKKAAVPKKKAAPKKKEEPRMTLEEEAIALVSLKRATRGVTSIPFLESPN